MTDRNPHNVGHHQRRIRYIDESIQKWLITGMLILEGGGVVGLAWLMYRRLNQTIEDNLYRAHLAAMPPLLGQLLHDAVPLLGIFLVANVVALLVAQLIWRRHLNKMLRSFSIRINRIKKLDFSPDNSAPPSNYRLLTLMEEQRTQEAQRFAAIRERTATLEAKVSESGDIESIRTALNELEKLLPS